MPRSKSKRKLKKTTHKLSAVVPQVAVSEFSLIKDVNRLDEKIDADIKRGLDKALIQEKYDSEVNEIISNIENAKLQRNKMLSEIDQFQKVCKTTDNDNRLFALIADASDLEFEISASSLVLMHIAPKFSDNIENRGQFPKNENRTYLLKEFLMILLMIPIGWITRLVFRFAK